jgi:hypothetical protein
VCVATTPSLPGSTRRRGTSRPIRGPYDLYVAEADVDRAVEILDEAEAQGERLAFEPLSVDDLPARSRAGTAGSIVFWAGMFVVAIPLVAMIAAILIILLKYT